jgi:hypothetical protein
VGSTRTTADILIDAGIDGEEAVAHYGVDGMHWGKHLPGRSEDSHNPEPKVHFRDTETGKETRGTYPLSASHDHVLAKELEKTPLHRLSNEEVRTLNNRKQLEQQYSQLNPSTLTRGHNKVKNILAVAGTVTLAVATAKKLYDNKAWIEALLKSKGAERLASKALAHV